MGNNKKPVLSSQLKETAQKDLLWFIHMICVFSLFWYVQIYGLFFWFIHWKVLIGSSQGANITQLGALPMHLGDLILFPGMALLGLGAVLVHTWDQCLQTYTFPLLSRPQASPSYNVMNTTLAAFSVSPGSWSLTDGHFSLVWLNLSHAHTQAAWHLTNNWASSVVYLLKPLTVDSPWKAIKLIHKPSRTQCLSYLAAATMKMPG